MLISTPCCISCLWWVLAHSGSPTSLNPGRFGRRFQEMQQLRQNLFLPSGERLPPASLKHAEDQTVAGLAAVCQAISTFQLGQTAFHDWGVLGAPRFLGRLAMHGAIQKFIAEGAWGISPHLIPHRLLHAVSGTVSLALKIQGPNFGVGGGPDGVGEAFLTAAALLQGGLGAGEVGAQRSPDLAGQRAIIQLGEPEEPFLHGGIDEYA